jgi:hypothetical protein
MMHTTLLLLLAQIDVAKRRLKDAASDDSGVSTLEVIVIALGLFLLAGAAVAVIANAVNSRTAQIN